jgi:hypothetical protein
VSLRVELDAILASLRTITGSPTVVLRAMLPANAAYPQSASHLIVDIVPTATSAGFAGTIYDDLLIQVGAWASENLMTALTLAEAARAKLEPLGYARTESPEIVREEAYHGVIVRYTLVAAHDTIT